MTLPNPKSEPTITVTRVAELLGVARGTAYQAVRAGAIPSLRIGRRILIPTAKVLTLLGLPEEELVSSHTTQNKNG